MGLDLSGSKVHGWVGMHYISCLKSSHELHDQEQQQQISNVCYKPLWEHEKPQVSTHHIMNILLQHVIDDCSDNERTTKVLRTV